MLIALSLFFAFSGCFAGAEFPEGLPHGESQILMGFNDANEPNQWFDFSEGKVVTDPDGAIGDIRVQNFLIEGSPSGRVMLNDMGTERIGFVDTAYSDTHFGWEEPNLEIGKGAQISLLGNHLYFCKTREGHYAMLKILNFETNSDSTDVASIEFDWVYQPNGSRVFRSTEVLEEGSEEEQQ